MIDAAKAFNIQYSLPGEPLIDQSVEIRSALASMGEAEEGEFFTFPPGIFACCDLDQIKAPIVGSGARRTTFVNLSPTNRLLEFQPWQGSGWGNMGGSFQGVKDIGIDSNMSAGSAIKMSTQDNYIHNVFIRNQGGGRNGGYAISVNNGTFCDLRNVDIINSDNGIEVMNTHYFTADNVSIERQDGYGLRMVNCPRPVFNALYLDNGNPRSVGKIVPAVAYIENCTSFLATGLRAEFDQSGTLEAGQATGSGNVCAFLMFKDCRNVLIQGGGLSHKTANPSSFMFFFAGGDATISNFEWSETKSAMIFASGCGDIKRLILDKISAYNTAGGSRWGLGMWYGKPSGAITSVRDWIDHGNPVSHQP